MTPRRVLSVFWVTLIAIAAAAQWSDVPAYHSAAARATDKLAPILSGAQLTGPAFQERYVKHAYELAAKVDKVLYQMPCYCYCDRNFGHKSLRSCFESTHGAECGTCMQEMYYTYQQTKAGKTAAQIRTGIMRGDFQRIDLRAAGNMQ